MITVTVSVCGDWWSNPNEVYQQILANHDASHITLDLCAEGPSLSALGIMDLVLDCCTKSHRNPDTILIDNWHNAIEVVPFRRRLRPRISHFFWMSDAYRHAGLQTPIDQYQLAFFVGRITPARAIMLYDIQQMLGDKVLLSLMRGHGDIPRQQDRDFLMDQTFDSWWKNINIQSIDQHWVRDQYDASQNTNRDLMSFYHLFSTELVAETYCRGITFFPTEKTVRPLSQGKALIVYGPRGFLANLKKLGFKTWDTLWDESYDAYEGVERWWHIKNILHQTQWESTHQQVSEIGDHNKQVLQTLINKYSPR